MSENEILENVAELRNAARLKRNNAVIDKDSEELAEARDKLLEAIEILSKEANRSDVDREKVVRRWYQCLGSVGGTWRDAAILSIIEGALDADEFWEKSIQYYDDGYKLESGKDPRSENLEFHDSYNLVQRIIVRVLREPMCQYDASEKRGSGTNVPKSAEEAQDLIELQLKGRRVDDAWAMADLAELRLLFKGATCEEAWKDFGAKIRSAEAYETNYRAFTALKIVGRACSEQPTWLPVVEETVVWHAEQLRIHHKIHVTEGLF